MQELVHSVIAVVTASFLGVGILLTPFKKEIEKWLVIIVRTVQI